MGRFTHKKPIYRGELPKKGGAWSVCRFKGCGGGGGGWRKRGGGVLRERVMYVHYDWSLSLLFTPKKDQKPVKSPVA